MTTIEALAFLKHQAKKTKLGTNPWLEIIQVIRNLVEDRRLLQNENEELTKVNKHLTRSNRKPHPTEGNGRWDVDTTSKSVILLTLSSQQSAIPPVASLQANKQQTNQNISWQLRNQLPPLLLLKRKPMSSQANKPK